MTLSEKVAYLTGLKEGLNLNADRPETKLFSAIIDVLNDTAVTLDGMEIAMAEVLDQVNALDEDLSAVESAVLQDEDYGFEAYAVADEDLAEDVEDLFEVKCPNCETLMYLDEAVVAEGSVKCPKCGKILEFEIEEA